MARLLHPHRRRSALAHLRSRPVPRRVLVLCAGNICRSPYVHAYLKRKGADLGLSVDSAGFMGPGRPPPAEAVQVAGGRGIDTRDHISALVTEDAVARADLVLLVDPDHGRHLRRDFDGSGVDMLVLGDLDPESVGSRTIRDPWGGDAADFEEVFVRLDRCLDVLLEEWRRRGPE